MRDFLTGRAKALRPSGIRKYFDIVETLPDAISLGVGEPDFVTPWDIRSAGIRSLQKGYTSYTGNRGLSELRGLISRYLSERFGVQYAPDRIIVTVGASEGIDLALRTTCEAGDEVLLPDPAYVSYAPIVSLCGGVPVSVSCTAENGFVPEDVFLERLPEIAKNAIGDACTGSNPRQPSQEEMERLLKCCYYDTEVDF